jgi:cell division protein FtsL
MANQNPFQRIQLVFKHSSKLTKIIVLCAIVFSTVTLLTLRHTYLEAQAQTEALRQQAAQLQQENEKLKEYINSLGTLDSVDRISQEELGLVDPDSVIIQPES